MKVFLLVGGTNNEQGILDDCCYARCGYAADLYEAEVKAGRQCQLLVSGGVDPEFSFNPTDREHWRYMANVLFAIGVGPEDIIRPGLPARHTVEEAVHARQYCLERSQSEDPALPPISELVVIAPEYHAPRVRHLFGVAFGDHAGCPIPMRVEEHPGRLTGEALAVRQAHEVKALETLRTAPFGMWADFIQAHGLEAANRSKRWAKRLKAAAGGEKEPPPPNLEPVEANGNNGGIAETAKVAPAAKDAEGAGSSSTLGAIAQASTPDDSAASSGKTNTNSSGGGGAHMASQTQTTVNAGGGSEPVQLS